MSLLRFGGKVLTEKAPADETPILEYGNEVAFFNQVELRKESIVESLRKILDSKRFRASVGVFSWAICVWTPLWRR